MQIKALLLLSCILAVSFIRAGELLEFSDNSEWGKVEAESYIVSISRNGSMMLDVKDTTKMKISLIRQWVAFQNFPTVRMMSAEKTEENNTVSLIFRYHWDDGSVVERLNFDSRGLEAVYEFTPWEDRSIVYTALYFEPVIADDITYNALAAGRGDYKMMEVSAASKDAQKERYMSLAFRGNSARYAIDLIAFDNSLFSIESFPKILTHNRVSDYQWMPKRKAGEVLKLSFRLFISGKDGLNLPESPIKFRN